MPRTNAQAKKKTPGPTTPLAKKKTPSSPSRRRTLPSEHEPAPLAAAERGPHVSQGPPPGSLSAQLAAELTAAWPDLQALAHWWQERQRLAQQDETPARKLVRQTYHIEQRSIEAVKREADRTGESYAAVVNRAFARYFTRR